MTITCHTITQPLRPLLLREMGTGFNEAHGTLGDVTDPRISPFCWYTYIAHVVTAAIPAGDEHGIALGVDVDHRPRQAGPDHVFL
jgi:hypothetical protein